MADAWISLGLPPTIWLASLGIITLDYFTASSFGAIGTISWVVFILGILYFVGYILGN